MKALDYESVQNVEEQPWFLVLYLDLPRESATAWFEQAPHVMRVDGFGEADFWWVECDCGLQLGFEFRHITHYGRIYATEPVEQHVGRHLKHWKDRLHAVPPDMDVLERNHHIETFGDRMPWLKELKDYQLWRQGDDGNEMRIGEPTSKWDAECWRNELESHKHKQTYWITRVE